MTQLTSNKSLSEDKRANGTVLGDEEGPQDPDPEIIQIE